MEFITSGPWASLTATLWLGIIVWTAARIGALAIRAFPGSAEWADSERFLFSVGAGFTLISLSVLALGMAGRLYADALIFMLLVYFSVPRFLRVSVPRPRVTISLRSSAFWLLSGAFLLSWVQALAPPTGMDALAYHLDHARHFALDHRVAYLPFTRESMWPYQTEMLFTMGLMLEGTTLAQLFHWVFYALTALATARLAARVAGEQTAVPAALIFVFTPAAFAQSGVPYVDLSFAFFTLLGFLPLARPGADSRRSHVVLSALFCGAAAGTKMLGLGSALIIGVLWIFLSRQKFKHAVLFGLACFAVGGIWYLRSWATLGNPFYPFFPRYFAGHGFDFDIAANVGRESGLIGFAKLLWNMSLHPASFGGELLGPVYLMLIPTLVIATAKPTRKASLLGAFIILYTYFLYTQSQHLRFYLSVAPFLAVACAFAYERTAQGSVALRRGLSALLTAVFLLHSGLFLYRVRDIWRVPLGLVSARQYLAEHERSFKLYTYLKENLMPGETFLNAGEVRTFYNPVPAMAVDCIPWRLFLAKQGVSLESHLAAENYDYVLFQNETDPAIRTYITTHSYEKVYEYSFTEKPATFHYQLYRKIA